MLVWQDLVVFFIFRVNNVESITQQKARVAHPLTKTSTEIIKSPANFKFTGSPLCVPLQDLIASLSVSLVQYLLS